MGNCKTLTKILKKDYKKKQTNKQWRWYFGETDEKSPPSLELYSSGELHIVQCLTGSQNVLGLNWHFDILYDFHRITP